MPRERSSRARRSSTSSDRLCSRFLAKASLRLRKIPFIVTFVCIFLGPFFGFIHFYNTIFLEGVTIYMAIKM